MYIKEINIKNRVYNYYFDNLIKARKVETKNILIDENAYKSLKMSIKMLILYYHELILKIEENEKKNI